MSEGGSVPTMVGHDARRMRAFAHPTFLRGDTAEHEIPPRGTKGADQPCGSRASLPQNPLLSWLNKKEGRNA